MVPDDTAPIHLFPRWYPENPLCVFPSPQSKRDPPAMLQVIPAPTLLPMEMAPLSHTPSRSKRRTPLVRTVETRLYFPHFISVQLSQESRGLDGIFSAWAVCRGVCQAGLWVPSGKGEWPPSGRDR